MVSGLLEINQGKIYYQESGHGETLVFLHGFTLDHTMWSEQVEYFKASYRVITLDLRGFGKSSTPSAPYSYQVDLKALLDYLQIDKIHLVGLSLGGEEALNFALDYPERILSLTLVSSSLGGYASTVDWDVKAQEQGLEIAKQNWLNHEVFRSSKNYPEVEKKLREMVEGYTGWHWMNSGLRIRPPVPAIDRLEVIDTRVMVMVGELDLPYYHEIAKLLSSEIKDITSVEIEDCGHMLTMENPAKFNDLLSDFLSKEKEFLT